MSTTMKARVTSFAPQFLVDDLDRSIAYYQKLGFSFGEPWDGFYAIGHLDGLEVHLKEAPKNPAERSWRRDNEHLDASAGVDGIEAFYEQCVANGVTIIKPLAATGHEGLLHRRPRRLHHLLRWPSGPRLTSEWRLCRPQARAAPARVSGTWRRSVSGLS